MSRIQTFQRRALEKVAAVKIEADIIVGDSKRYFLGGKELFLAGISKGVGTCADLPGVDIAVLSEVRISQNCFPVKCSGLALLRYPTPEEWSNPDLPRMVVEGIEVERITGRSVYLEKNGKKELYSRTL